MRPSELNFKKLIKLMEAMAQNHRAMADLLDDMRMDNQDSPPESDMLNLSVDDMTRERTIRALYNNHGNAKNAARELGISERTIYRYIKKWNLS